jgi:hypothetical protein
VVARRLAVPAAIALAAVLVAAGLVVFAFRGEARPPAPPPGSDAAVRPLVRATLEPDVHAVGPRVTATLELLVPTRELEPETVRPSSDFEPYRVVGEVRRELRELGDLSLVRYQATLECVREACVPEAQTGEFRFASAAFTWKTPPPPGRKFKDRRLDQRTAGGDWPTLKVTTRLTAQELQDASWRSSLAELPAPSYRVVPRWLVGGLVGGSVALVLAAAALVAGWARQLRARAETDGAEPQAAAEPLDLALAYVDEANGNGDVPAQRIALETLARELREQGQERLAGDAERLAWSPSAPPAAEVAELTDTVRRLDGGRP